MGAVMSYATGLGEGRPVPAGILAISGFVPTVDGWAPELSSRQGLPVFIAHGSQDPVIPVEFARQARELLEAGGQEVTYEESGAAHHVEPAQVPAIVEWLETSLPAARPACMPSTKPSSSEFEPMRLAPCKPVDAHSPTAHKPRTCVRPSRSTARPPTM